MNYTWSNLSENTVNRYRSRYHIKGITPQTLGWGCSNDQETRFHTMIYNYDFNQKSILDIGCGFADFYATLCKHSVSCSYYGIDVVPEFIDHCKKKFPNISEHFSCCDFNCPDSIIPKTDVIVSNGTLNFKIDDNFSYTKHFIEKAFAIAGQTVIVDFLSTHLTATYPKEDFVYYHSPAEVLEFALTLTENVRLIHNYAPIPQKEFMIILDK